MNTNNVSPGTISKSGKNPIVDPVDRILFADHFKHAQQNVRQKRTCLKCSLVFISTGYGNRMCASCRAVIAKHVDRHIMIQP